VIQTVSVSYADMKQFIRPAP